MVSTAVSVGYQVSHSMILVDRTNKIGGLSWATHAGLTPSLTPLSRLPASVSPAVRGGVSRSRHQIRESVAHVANRREWTSSHSDPPPRPSGSYLDSFRSESGIMDDAARPKEKSTNWAEPQLMEAILSS